jgi:hypothetical protein
MPIGPAGKCPEEAFTGRKVSVSHIKTFGCIIYANIPRETRGKLEPVSRKTIFVGYLPTLKQYKLYDPVAREVLVSTAPKFAEDEFWAWPDEPEEQGVDVESLDPMEPVDLDLNELLRTQVDDLRAEPENNSVRRGSEELQARQPQEGAEDIVRPQEGADDSLQPQEASNDEITDENTIVVDTGSPVEVRNDPQGSGISQSEGAQGLERRSGRERRPTRFFE